MKSHYRYILFAIICFAFITIYLLRFLQVMNMRQLLLQRKNFKYVFTSFNSSVKNSNSNYVYAPGIIVVLPLDTEIYPGDQLEVIGSFDRQVQSVFKERITLTSRSIRYLNRGDSYGLFSVFRLIKLLEEIPQVATHALSTLLEYSQVHLLSGMVFGGSNRLPKSLLEDMKNTGLLHVTSASGFNVALVIGFSLSLFTRVINRRIAVILSLITVIAYSIMAGLSPPITRAAGMGVLYLFSFLLGKQYSVLRSMAVTLAILLIYQPFLIFSISLLLSVASTLGVIFTNRVFTGRTEYTGVIGDLRSILEENLKTTISVLLFSTPILVGSLGNFSLVAPLANMLLLWMVPYLTLVGIFLPLVNFISPLVANLLSWPVSLSIEVFMRSVRLFSQFPFSNLQITSPHWWGTLAWYTVLFLFLARRWQKLKKSANYIDTKKSAYNKDKT